MQFRGNRQKKSVKGESDHGIRDAETSERGQKKARTILSGPREPVGRPTDRDQPANPEIRSTSKRSQIPRRIRLPPGPSRRSSCRETGCWERFCSDQPCFPSSDPFIGLGRGNPPERHLLHSSRNEIGLHKYSHSLLLLSRLRT